MQDTWCLYLPSVHGAFMLLESWLTHKEAGVTHTRPEAADVGSSLSVLATLCGSGACCSCSWGGAQHLGLRCYWCHCGLGADCKRPERNDCHAQQAEAHCEPAIAGRVIT